MKDDDPDDVPELALISDAREFAASAEMILENPRMKAGQGNSGIYVTALTHTQLILHLVREVDECTGAQEFDALLYLICCNADGLARTLSLLRIP